MNCHRFQDQLFEYVEGSLPAGAMAAAEKHLAGCSACREAVRQEKALAQGLSRRLQQDVQTLKLSAEIRRNILTAARREPAPRPLTKLILGWWTRFAVPLSAGAAALAIGAALWLSHSPGPQKHSIETAHRSGSNPPPMVAVQLSSQVPVWQFRREGDVVVDTLSVHTIVANVTLHPFSETEQ